MANPYSYLNNFNEPLYSPDFGLISQALQFKQSNLNLNRANLQKYYDDTVQSIQVIKDVDKNYVNQRISAVTNLANQYASQDLSSPGLSTALQSDISLILDDTVKNAVTSTAVFKAEQKAWNDFKEKNPDDYSQINYEFSQRNTMDYLNDPNVGAKYNGGGGVIPYTDVDAKINKFLPGYLKDRGIEQRISSSGNPYFYDTVKRKNITKDEVLLGVNAVLSDKDRNQLSINAWGTFQTFEDSQVRDLYNNFRSDKIQEVNDSIKELQLSLKSPYFTKQQKVQIQENIGLLNQRNKELNKTTFAGVGRDSATNSIYMDGYMSKFANAYSVDNQILEQTRTLDKVEFEKMKQAHEVNKLTIQQLSKAKETKLLGILAGSPTSIDQTATELEDLDDPFHQLNQNLDENYSTLKNQGLLPDRFDDDTDMEGLITDLYNFSGILQRDAAGNLTGKFRGKNINEEQSLQLLQLADDYKKVYLTNKEEITNLDAKEEELYKWRRDSELFTSANLSDFKFKVSTEEYVDEEGNTQSRLKVAPKSSQDLTYSQLAIKDRNGESLTKDEKETLKLYRKYDFGISGGRSSDTEANKTRTNNYFRDLAGRYEKGNLFLPRTLEETETWGVTALAGGVTMEEKYPYSFTSGLEQKGLERIANKFYNGKFPYIPGEGLLSDGLPDEFDSMLDKIVQDPDYVFTSEDFDIARKNMRIFMSSTIGSTFVQDSSYGDIGSGDIAIKVEGSVFLSKPVATFENFYTEKVESALEFGQELTKFQLGVQDFTFTFDNTKKVKQQEILNTLNTESGKNLVLGKESVLRIKIDKEGTSTVTGLFKEVDEEGKLKNVQFTKDNSLSLSAEGAAKHGIEFRLELATTYDTTLGEEASQLVAPVPFSYEQDQIIDDFFKESLRINGIQYNQDIANILEEYKKSTQVRLYPNNKTGQYHRQIIYPDQEVEDISIGSSRLQLNQVQNLMQASSQIFNDQNMLNVFLNKLLSEITAQTISE